MNVYLTFPFRLFVILERYRRGVYLSAVKRRKNKAEEIEAKFPRIFIGFDKIKPKYKIENIKTSRKIKIQ